MWMLERNARQQRRCVLILATCSASCPTVPVSQDAGHGSRIASIDDDDDGPSRQERGTGCSFEPKTTRMTAT
jgi:hypothetical protein